MAVFLTLAILAAGDFFTVRADWRGVSDSVVQNCELEGLQTLLLQGLLESGHALVEVANDDTIALEIRSTNNRFSVRVQQRDFSRVRELLIPQNCDATIALGLVRLAQQLVAEVPKDHRGGDDSVVMPEEDPARIPEPRWPRLGLGSFVSTPASGDFVLGLGGWLAMPVLEQWVAQTRMTVAYANRRDVSIFEPELSGAMLYDFSGLRVGGRAAFVLHVFDAPSGTDTVLDSRLAVVGDVELKPSWLRVSIQPYVRSRRIEHRFGSEVVHRSSRIGIWIGLDAAVR